MKKRLALGAGALGIAVVAAALSTGTYAYFSDTVVLPTQQIVSGSLTLTAGQAAGSAPLGTADIAPGSPPRTTKFTLHNTGTLPGALFLSVHEGAGTDPDLARELLISITDGAGHTTGMTALSTAASAPHHYFGTLQPDQTRTVQLTVALAPRAPNDTAGKSATFSLRATLEQIPR